MDEVSARLQSRPYYDPDTFNAGYPAVFRPDKGVIDPHGFTIASKLKIVQDANSGLKNSNLMANANDGFITRILSGWTKGVSKHNRDSYISSGACNGNVLSDNLDNMGNKSIEDLEWNDLLNINIWKKIMSHLLGEFTRRYIQHLIQQPFEVSRCLLQVGDFSDTLAMNNQKVKLKLPISLHNDDVDNDTIEDVNFFPDQSEVSVIPDINIPDTLSKNDFNDVMIKPESLHVLDIMNSLMEKEGIRGLWRANNTTFIYNFFNMTLNVWLIGLLSPFFGISDPNFFESILETSTSYSSMNDIKISMILTISSNILTNIMLIPLDLIRTKLLVTYIQPPVPVKAIENTKSANNLRSLRDMVKDWSWKRDMIKLPLDMWILTILNSLTTNNRTSSTIFSEKMFTLIWVKQFHLTKDSKNIKWYHISFSVFEMIGIFIKLPIETMLRRCQVNYLLARSTQHDDKIGIKHHELIIKPIDYDKNLLIWRIGSKSIDSTSSENNTNTKKKVIALWNGWRISIMSLLCGYCLKVLQKEERSTELEF